MPNLVALIDSNFTDMLAYYRMFSCDETWVGHIEIQPRDIHSIHLTSFEALLTQLRNHLLLGNREFLVGMHGALNMLPYPIINGTNVSPDVEFLKLLELAANGSTKSRDEMLTWTDDKNKKIFANAARADTLINLVRQIRSNRINHLEFRGCNIGAGGALQAIHDCLNSRYTVAPTVTFISGHHPTGGIQSISKARLDQRINLLSMPRRTFTNTECLLPFNSQIGSDDVTLGIQISEVSVHPHRFSIAIRALSQQAVQGWTKTYLENSYYYYSGNTPSGGGYRLAGNLPIISMWSPQGKKPFLFPGDSFDYLNVLATVRTP